MEPDKTIVTRKKLLDKYTLGRRKMVLSVTAISMISPSISDADRDMISVSSEKTATAEDQSTVGKIVKRPNILVLVVDDMRTDDYRAGGHPFSETPNIDRLVREGVTFNNAYYTTPLSSPSRASILTGQYTSRHGIHDNVSRSLSSHRLKTFSQELQKAGYETGHIGKWHMGNDPKPRPGYDFWIGQKGQGNSIDPELYENGAMKRVKGYITDIFTERSIEFIKKERGDKPFMLYIGHKALHVDVKQLKDGSIDTSSGSVGYVPAPRHKGRYADAEVIRPPNALKPGQLPEGKSVIKGALQFIYSSPFDHVRARMDLCTSDNTIRSRAEMLLAIDDGIGQIMKALDEIGELDNTFILLTSDNGYFYGEHGLGMERRLAYEPSIHAPFIVRYPPMAKAGSQRSEFVLNIDIAPTLIELAGLTPGLHIQGKSILPVLKGESESWRNSFLIEHISEETVMPWLVNMGYKAVRMDNYKYIHWLHYDNADELYDLEADPYEQQNLIGNQEYAFTLRKLRQELKQLVIEAHGLPE